MKFYSIMFGLLRMLFTVDVDLTRKIVQIPLDECKYRSIYLPNIQSIDNRRKKRNFLPIKLNFTICKWHKNTLHTTIDRIDCVSYKYNLRLFFLSVVYRWLGVATAAAFCSLVVEILLYELAEKYKIQPEKR